MRLSCPRKQQEPLIVFDLTTVRLRVIHATQCATPPAKFKLGPASIEIDNISNQMYQQLYGALIIFTIYILNMTM